MNNSKMIKQLMPLLAIIMCSALISGCSSNNNQTSESNDSEVVVETKESKEEIVNEVLRISYTITEDESESFLIDGKTVGIFEDRVNKVKTYFTDHGFDFIRKTRMMVPLYDIFVDKEFTSTVDEIELDFRETSNSDELVCSYKLNLTINFKDDSVEPFTSSTEGEMTLLKKDSWKINYYMNNLNSLYIDFTDHINN